MEQNEPSFEASQHGTNISPSSLLSGESSISDTKGMGRPDGMDVDKDPVRTVEREKPRKYIGKYKLSKTIGQGTLGKVKIAVDTLTGATRACKIIHYRGIRSIPVSSDPLTTSVGSIPGVSTYQNTDQGTPQCDMATERKIVKEAAIGLLLKHPNICELLEIAVMSNYYYFFFEFVEGGHMLDHIISHGPFQEKHARKLMRQLISAVDYCHFNNIVHRDLKIENILLDAHGNVKLIDFGFSNLYSSASQLSTFCGSLYYAAPELLRAKPYIGPEIDIWSLGVILYVLVCGRVPFDDESLPALQAKIKRGRVVYPPHLSNDCKDLISEMLIVDPNLRVPMKSIKYHRWILDGLSSLPDNNLPKRSALNGNIDDDILRHMKGFEFGSEDAMRQRLLACQGDSHPSLDPILSVYHLVREKLQRERCI